MERLERIEKRLDEIAATAKSANGHLAFLTFCASLLGLLVLLSFFVTFCGALG
ncbi:MAG: hypothetical protein OXI45_13630 [Acidobacteriota bacterium]|nr:hypothetical protein [Acidobacteriota bacterium]